jgi:hypothetical protein
MKNRVLVSLMTLSLFQSQFIMAETTNAGGMKGIQFEKANIDLSYKCNLVILKSSKNDGTFYITPQPFVSINKNKQNLFSINDYYSASNELEPHLEFSLFFTENSIEAMKYRDSKSEFFTNTCDLENVREKYNEGKMAADQIKTFDFLPIYRAEVSIPSVSSEIVEIGDKNSNFLDITRKDKKIRLNLKNKMMASNLRNEINSNQGIDIKIDYYFSAAHEVGSIEASFDREEFILNLQNEIGTSVPVKMVQANLDIKTKIRNALNNTSIQINVNGGEQDEFLKNMATKIADDFIGKISLAPMISPSNPKEEEKKEKEKEEKEEEKKEEGGNPLKLVDVNVKAYVEMLFQTSKITMKVNKNSDSSERKVTTFLRFKEKVEQSGINKLLLDSVDNKGTEIFLPVGKELTILFNGKTFEALELLKSEKYYTKEDIRQEKEVILKMIPSVQNYIHRLEEVKRKEFDTLSADGETSITRAGRRAYWFDDDYYVWGEEAYRANYVELKASDLEEVGKRELTVIQKGLQVIHDQVEAARHGGQLLAEAEKSIEEHFSKYNITFNFPDYISSFGTEGFSLADFVLNRVSGVSYAVDYTRGALTIRSTGRRGDEDLKIVIRNSDTFEEKSFVTKKYFEEAFEGSNIFGFQNESAGRNYKTEKTELLEVKKSVIHLTTIERMSPELLRYNVELSPALDADNDANASNGLKRKGFGSSGLPSAAPAAPLRSGVTEVDEDEEGTRIIDTDDDN